jgi:hypothetical protein
MFLGKFLSGEIRELEPVYTPKKGYNYPVVATIIGEPSQAEAFLNKLYEAGILTRRLFDKVVFCPKCGSTDVSVRFHCPYCKSFDIQKSSLIEHVKCGYMDVEENFKKDGTLICPKCHEELRKANSDHRRAGIWCTCKDCRKSFDIPVAGLFCLDCQQEFTFEDVAIEDVYSYSMKEEAKKEASQGWILISPISELLVENGFEVKSPAFVKGRSGANHMFDIVASKSQKTSVVDIAISTDSFVSEQPVIALFAKIFDVSPDSAYLIAIPRLNDNARNMTKLYNIQAVEGKNQEEAINSLRHKLRK